MADEAKHTVASLAQKVEQLANEMRVDTGNARDIAAEGKEAAQLALAVGEELGKKLTSAQEQLVTLAKLVNGLCRKPGEAVKPDVLDNVLARLEKVERNGTQDWGPLFEAHKEQQGKLVVAVKELGDQVAAIEDKAGVQPGGPFEDLARQVEAVAELTQNFDQLQAAVARLEHAAPDTIGAPVHQSLLELVDRRTDSLLVRLERLEGDNAYKAVREELLLLIEERIREAVRNRASFEQDLLARVRNLEDSGLPGGLSSTVTMESARPAKVHEQVLQLMDEVDYISKDRKASGGGVTYKFRGIEDAQNAVGAAMRKVRLVLAPEVISWEHSQESIPGFDAQGKPRTVVWSTSRLTMRYTFISPFDGSKLSFEMVGEGRDNSDKSASKAASMACKYALFQALMIGFEQVDESDGQTPIIERPREDRTDTPGARVSRGEITPAQAVQEYTAGVVAQRGPIDYPRVQSEVSTGYDPAADSSAMAGSVAPDEDSRAQKAAKAAHYLKQAQAQPADVALPAIAKLKARVEAHGLGDLGVAWSDGEKPIPLITMINTALQSVNAAIAQRAQAAGAQGVTRQGQQAGEGARALNDNEPGQPDGV